MNLQKLTQSIARYKAFLMANPRHDPYWKWESLKIFQENWNIETEDFRNMFDACLQNSHSRRLWKRENYAPKGMFLKFIDLNGEYVRFIFKDLYDETKDIEGRVDRFVFYCNELLKEYKEANPLSIENRHFHDDNYEMISIYLAFRFPEKYTPYHFETFKKFMQVLGSLDVPNINDVSRYFKVMRTVDKFLQKEEEIFKMHQKRLNVSRHFTGNTLLLVEDFCRVTTL